MEINVETSQKVKIISTQTFNSLSYSLKAHDPTPQIFAQLTSLLRYSARQWEPPKCPTNDGWDNENVVHNVTQTQNDKCHMLSLIGGF